MRTTRREYLEFAEALDKLISENLNREFFKAEGISIEEATGKRAGRITITQKGTLQLLEEWVGKRVRFKVRDAPAKIVAPMKEIRRLRGKPAHQIITDEYAHDYQRMKEKLIQDLYVSVSNIRVLFQTHPGARSYDFPTNLKLENIVLY